MVRSRYHHPHSRRSSRNVTLSPRSSSSSRAHLARSSITRDDVLHGHRKVILSSSPDSTERSACASFNTHVGHAVFPHTNGLVWETLEMPQIPPLTLASIYFISPGNRDAAHAEAQRLLHSQTLLKS